jgi:ERCC4-related helicase
MQYQVIVGKTNEYLHKASAGLAKWLDNYLPQRKDRWERYVINKLGYDQRNYAMQNGWTRLEELDLSALLRVADRNFLIISQKYFLNYAEKDCIEKMFGVRNRWAHVSGGIPIAVPQIISDLETLKFFYGQIDVDPHVKNDIIRFTNQIKAEGVTDEPVSTRPAEPVIEQEIENLQVLGIGSIVRLTSDPSKLGMIQSVSNIGSEQQYTVFMDGTLKNLFASQIEPEPPKQGKADVDISELLMALTARLISSPSSNSLYSLNSSRIDFVPYQFRPVLKLIKSGTPRLLIADSVGVGKTIEAGLILKEMKVRMPLETVFIICPKPLVAERKWELEMKEKFGEAFEAADSGLLSQIIKNYQRDGEWDKRYKRLIIPYSILTNDLFNGVEGRDGHPGLANLIPELSFDMLIVDEAHRIKNNPGQAHKIVKFLCECTNSVLFLTATPIQPGSHDLYTLLNLLFPDVVMSMDSFTAMGQPNERVNKAVKLLRAGTGHETEALAELTEAAAAGWGSRVIAQNPVYSKSVQLLSKDILNREQRVSLINDIESLHSFSKMINRTRRQDIGDFCVRRAKTLESEFTEKQKELHDTLLGFEREVLSILHGNISAYFLLSTISRQASSCLFGLAPHIKDFVQRRFSALCEGFDDDPDDINIDPKTMDQIGEMAKGVVTLAENLPAEDPKFDKLAEILRERQKTDNGKTIIFSTFRHTLAYLHGRIEEELKLRTAQIDGSVPDEERFSLRERFTLPKDNPESLDVLLFSEAGSEGLDYQFCNAMVNYDIPWNPMRIEQRIGRIDRRGQKSEFVDIYNCVTKGTVDADVFERCHQRMEIFEKSLGECSDILENIENSIKDIVFDRELTEKQRADKLEKMADNQIALINENRQLEEQGKEIFGFDMSGFDDDIEKADNPFISPNSLRRLVDGYFEKRFGDNGPYIEDDKLKLNSGQKLKLLEDYQTLTAKNKEDKIWENYLKNTEKTCPVTFRQDEAKERRKSIFITPSHPLVFQAAKCFSDKENMFVTLFVSRKDIPSGEYPFSVFSWEYKGQTSRSEFVPVCENENLRNELLSLLQEAVTTDIDYEQFRSAWESQKVQHKALWQKECDRYKAEVKFDCDFRMQSLQNFIEGQKRLFEKQIEEAEDEKIICTRRAQIERLENDFERKRSKFENNARMADIHSTLVVNGVLAVKEEN